MEKLWRHFEKASEKDDYDVEIVRSLIFGPEKKLGEIRDVFNTWSIYELERTAEMIYYSPTSDEGVEDNMYFGYKTDDNDHPYREGMICQSHAHTMWGLSSRKKKFF